MHPQSILSPSSKDRPEHPQYTLRPPPLCTLKSPPFASMGRDVGVGSVTGASAMYTRQANRPCLWAVCVGHLFAAQPHSHPFWAGCAERRKCGGVRSSTGWAVCLQCVRPVCRGRCVTIRLARCSVEPSILRSDGARHPLVSFGQPQDRASAPPFIRSWVMSTQSFGHTPTIGRAAYHSVIGDEERTIGHGA